jgi:hypothetical protein
MGFKADRANAKTLKLRPAARSRRAAGPGRYRAGEGIEVHLVRLLERVGLQSREVGFAPVNSAEGEGRASGRGADLKATGPARRAPFSAKAAGVHSTQQHVIQQVKSALGARGLAFGQRWCCCQGGRAFTSGQRFNAAPGEPAQSGSEPCAYGQCR